ncbi:dihydrolipoamide acetyltransferase [Idiomarina sp. OT37-5b]|jgi:2-oxoisovalerate dehydrogenase E2 component (dihydrolipoyl transacylase)|uniref:dihydrolipoyllysine-residue acetyltransferase n=1 Tax=Idiomarina sp. OT37-5b TaxID=2100422 RepID=UPI000CF9B13A|nr:dihydrolipoyllysine-residue acetyltransferase [Idiomarina sp. OT37-5b]AVJ56311.1 dihydrolipoamide acetyltransferase [Idiomarina sp. OT37-5b]
MSKDFILPDIGEGIVECEIVEWLVAEGDQVKEDQPVVEVMTDKAMVEIPAKEDGVVEKLYYAKGDIAKVHEPLFRINAGGDAAEEQPTEDAKPAPEQTRDSGSAAATTDFILPDIGEGIVECEIVEWLVSEGDQVKEDQPVVEVMTDKATVEIPAKDDGVVVKLYHKKGDIAEVHKPLFALQPAGGVESAPSTSATQKTTTDASAKAEATAEPPAKARQGKAIASPAVRRLARENDINIADVPGSGKKGRVLKQDIEAFKSGDATAASRTDDAHASDAAPAAGTTTGGTRTEAIRGVKAAMAKQMMKSVSTIPHFTYADEFDVTDLIALREKLKEQYKEKGIRLTVMPFFIKALSLALKEFPVMNAQVNEDCTEITYFDDHNIGMAVDTKIGLLVPNVKQVQNKSIIDVANEVTRLTQAAREGKVPQADMKGGTISISNIGVIGGTVATPIINKPEAAIVALGKVQELPRFDANGNVVARKIMTVSWSGDHRIIDGGTIARFNKRWQEFLEDPTSMLVNMV